jgi:predicted metallopeptidase
MKKFYFTESYKFPEECKLQITDQETILISRKLARHFSFNLDKVSFRGNRQYGFAYNKKDEIRLSHNPNIELMCHELAHIHNRQKFNNPHHNKKLMRTIEKFLKFCKKNNYWRKEENDLNPT